jgi:proline dehydrogenase
VSLVDHVIVRTLPLVPRGIVQRVSSRYIAGAELADAQGVVRALNADGKLATLDVLGEEVTGAAEASAFAHAYVDVLAAIDADGLDANVSVKPTALGLELGREVFRANLGTVVRAAAERGNFVRIDMEDSATTDATLATYRELRAAGHDNLGIVLQSALRRTLADVRALAELRPSVRVCKGIYIEREEIAFTDPDEIRRSFLDSVAALLDGGSRVALATHDEPLLADCLRLVRERGLEPHEYELQFLLGVKPDVATRLARDGHRLRVYVPFGPRWYEYSVRRLRENPRMATTVARALLRRPATRR